MTYYNLVVFPNGRFGVKRTKKVKKGFWGAAITKDSFLSFATYRMSKGFDQWWDNAECIHEFCQTSDKTEAEEAYQTLVDIQQTMDYNVLR